jgi:hypothetical protein
VSKIVMAGRCGRYRRAVDLDDVTFDPVLVAVAAVFAVCAIYLLFLRNSVMWGFICIIGVVVVGIVMVSPDVLNR